MINFVDRIPTQTGQRKITYADGTSEYVTVEMADNPTVEGTPLNRAAFMALQGFEAVTTVFNTDGSITATNAAGDMLVTTFLTNGNTDTELMRIAYVAMTRPRKLLVVAMPKSTAQLETRFSKEKWDYVEV